MKKNKVSIFLLGCRAAGKTSFISGLSLLSRPGHGSPFQIVTNDGPTTKIITDLRSMAERQEWPAPTSSLVPLDLELTYQSQTFKLSILDYPGEDLLEAMETLSFEDRELILEHILAADCLLIVADPTQDLETKLNTDPVGGRRRQDALAQAVGQLLKHRYEKEGDNPLIALAISKYDLLSSNDIVIENIIRDNEVLIRKLGKYARRSTRPECFGISVCGTGSNDEDVEAGAYPQNPQPQGYEPLFSWILNQYAIRKHKNRIILFFSITSLLVITSVSWFVYRGTVNSAMAEQIKLSPISEISAIVNQHDTLPDEPLRALDVRFQSEIERIEGELEGASSAQDLQRLRNHLDMLLDVRHVSHSKELSTLLDQVETSQENALINEIKLRIQSGEKGKALALCADYRSNFPNGIRKAEVEDFELKLEDRRRQELRSSVRGIRIGNRDSLARKAAEIQRYLDAFPDDPDAQSMNAAIRLSGQLAATDSVRLHFSSCGFSSSKGKRKHSVRWLLDGRVLPTPSFKSESKLTMSTFKETLDLDFQKWNSLEIELWDLKFRNEKIAGGNFKVLQDLHQWNGSRRIPLSRETKRWIGSSAWIKIEIQLPSSEEGGWSAVDESTLEAYGSFISPGRHW